MDRRTGAVLTGWPHVAQSIEVILTTRIGERMFRRVFGSQVPKLLGEPLTNPTIVRFFAAVIAAIELWEPRFRVRSIDVIDGNSAERLRAGRPSRSAASIARAATSATRRRTDRSAA